MQNPDTRIHFTEAMRDHDRIIARAERQAMAIIGTSVAGFAVAFAIILILASAL
jgi:tetrahydromethanopterin S-methyltransferase subunit F